MKNVEYQLTLTSTDNQLKLYGTAVIENSIFEFKDNEDSYTCNLMEATLLKLNKEYKMFLDFLNKNQSYIELLAEDKRIVIDVSIRNIELSKNKMLVQYRVNDDSDVKLEINVGEVRL